MQSFLVFLCQYANFAPLILFCLLLLTGLSLPLSEDLLILTAGIIVSVCVPHDYLKLYASVFAGSLFSAWIAYSIGRFFGEKIYTISWFKHFITRNRIARLHRLYEKFGAFTFIVGRFFPGGIRNVLFMTSGLGKMPFPIFALRDGLACLISVSLLFNLGVYFGTHYKKIVKLIKTYDIVLLALIALISIIFLFMRSRTKKFKS